jgi:GH24 family phage-related lysozyme (muramidase)
MIVNKKFVGSTTIYFIVIVSVVISSIDNNIFFNHKTNAQKSNVTDMHASSNLIKFIITYEGNAGTKSLTGIKADVYGLYNDPEGNCTVGIGHLVHLGKCTKKDIAEHIRKFPLGETKADALKVLKEDLINVENDVKDNVKVPLSQNQFDALVDFVFNEGVDKLESSKLLKDVNKDNLDPSLIKDDFLQFTRHGGLTERRSDEANMFSFNDYTVSI